MSFNFMTVITVCSDFGAQENNTLFSLEGVFSPCPFAKDFWKLTEFLTCFSRKRRGRAGSHWEPCGTFLGERWESGCCSWMSESSCKKGQNQLLRECLSCWSDLGALMILHDCKAFSRPDGPTGWATWRPVSHLRCPVDVGSDARWDYMARLLVKKVFAKGSTRAQGDSSQPSPW